MCHTWTTKATCECGTVGSTNDNLYWESETQGEEHQKVTRNYKNGIFRGERTGVLLWRIVVVEVHAQYRKQIIIIVVQNQGWFPSSVFAGHCFALRGETWCHTGEETKEKWGAGAWHGKNFDSPCVYYCYDSRHVHFISLHSIPFHYVPLPLWLISLMDCWLIDDVLADWSFHIMTLRRHYDACLLMYDSVTHS